MTRPPDAAELRGHRMTRRPAPAWRGESVNGSGVDCPECGAGTIVTDSRHIEKTVKRRRCCTGCDLRFSTWEIIGESVSDIAGVRLAAAATLRRMADELDPPKPARREKAA